MGACPFRNIKALPVPSIRFYLHLKHQSLISIHSRDIDNSTLEILTIKGYWVLKCCSGVFIVDFELFTTFSSVSFADLSR